MSLGLDLSYLERSARGEFDLGWLKETSSEWGMRAVPSKTGLTMRDIAIGSYGVVPDHAPRRTMAPRGSDVASDVPDMGYTINDKSEVWADNVLDLYEEAVSRQWSATRDIPWGDLRPLDPDVEHAMCQLATVLSEVEMVAADFPAKWLWRINHDFIEAKMFLCTQVMDEARHTEVFRKRALANGGGLGKATAVVERFLQLILDAESYDEGSALMHLLGEGIVLSLFRAGAALAPSPVEQQIFRLCMQDEARHVAYGTMHLRYRLERDPSVAEDFHARQKNLVILTRDADFFDKLVIHGTPPKVVWLRTGNLRRVELEALVARSWPKVQVLLEVSDLIEIHLERLEALKF